MNKFVIYKDILINNLIKVRGMIKPTTRLCLMVKADAYGHGAKYVSKIAEEYVDYFGVACVSEGVKLRNSNISKPILVVGGFDKSMARIGVINNLTLTISTLDECEYVCRVAERLHISTYVHVKINTGMNRYGLSDKKVLSKIIDRINNSNYVHLEGVFSHLYDFENKKSTMQQIRRFNSYCRGLPKSVMKHILASGGLCRYPRYQLDMVRVGYMAYGYMGDCEPIVSIASHVSEIRYINVGDKVGYQGTYVANRSLKIATIPIGYADGLRLALSNKGYVIVRGNKCDIVGRICMDCCMIDVSEVDARVGDDVIVFDGVNNALEYAKIIKSSPYEVLTSFKTNRMKIVVK